jgi:hypothetical protein
MEWVLRAMGGRRGRVLVVVLRRRCSDERTSESLSLVSVWLPLRAPVCQQCRMLLPLGSACAGGDEVVFRRRQMAGEVGEGARVVERWLIRLLDRVHVGEARRTTFGLRPAVNQRPRPYQDVTRATSLTVEVHDSDCSYEHARI